MIFDIDSKQMIDINYTLEFDIVFIPYWYMF